MEELIPEFWKEAPLERPVIEQRFWMMDKESVVQFGYKGLEWGVEPYNNFTSYVPSLTNGLPKRQLKLVHSNK